MTDVLNVSLRNELGTGRVRRLRKAGHTPAILYGHGEACVNLALPTSEIQAVLRHGSKLVELRGEVSEKALIWSIQWDAFGSEVLHVDLTRVSEGERVTVTVPLEAKGVAPGTKEGGIIEHRVFDVEIECPAVEIPERLVASLKELNVGDSILAGQIELPPNVVMLTPADTLLVSCQAAAVSAEDEEESLGGASEPEIIGRKPDDTEDESN